VKLHLDFCSGDGFLSSPEFRGQFIVETRSQPLFK